MNILAFDTATDACSVALLAGDSVNSDHRLAAQQHAQLALPMIDTLMQNAGLQPHNIDCVAFGRGPGSFTGLRIAAALAQGIAFGADLPVVPVSSLQAIAQGLHRQFDCTHALAVLDARMDEVYAGAYVLDSNGLMQLAGEEQLCSAGRIDSAPMRLPGSTGANWMLAGSGADRYVHAITSAMAPVATEHCADLLPDARDILTLAAAVYQQGEAVSAEQAIPVYLRDRVALTEQQRVRGERL